MLCGFFVPLGTYLNRPSYCIIIFAEAIYENSRQLLDGSAVIYDAVRCRLSPLPSEGPKWGHGCDSVDNDCDRLVDTWYVEAHSFAWCLIVVVCSL
jgi:hypothetical protein